AQYKPMSRGAGVKSVVQAPPSIHRRGHGESRTGRALRRAPLLAERVKLKGVVRWRVWCRHCQEWHLSRPRRGAPPGALPELEQPVAEQVQSGGEEKTKAP